MQVGATGVSGVQLGLASDLQPTSRVPQPNTAGIAIGVSIGVIALAAVVVVTIVVLVVILRRQKRFKRQPLAAYDDDTRYVDFGGTRTVRSASEMVEKRGGTFDHDTAIANVPDVVSEEEEEEDAGEKSKLCSEDITTL